MSFPSLLKRSKFVSFDPAIAQVYTTYGGDAYRGDWGLKRPLPLRRRHAFITAESVDSGYQQTEWSPAHSQVRFIRRWEQLVVDARVSSLRIQNSPDSRVDSEFAPDNHPWPRERTTAVANIHAMSTKEFTAYLDRLRQLRPAFKQYLHTALANRPRHRGQSLYALAQIRDADYHQRFIASHTLNHTYSRTIEPVQHRTGGLLYSHPSPLETMFLSGPQPGFVLQTAQPSRREHRKLDQSLLASFAGLSATVRTRNAGGKVPLFDSREGINYVRAGDSITPMRILTCPKLASVPAVVGRAREGVNGVKVRVEVTARTDFMRPNPYRPGSREYNVMEPVAERGKSGRVVPMKWMSSSPPAKLEGEHGKNLLSTLKHINDGR